MIGNAVAADGDWFFIHPLNDSNKTNIFPVALWKEEENGKWCGLVGNVDTFNSTDMTNLVTPPPVRGLYIKRNKNNSSLIDQALANGNVNFELFS